MKFVKLATGNINYDTRDSIQEGNATKINKKKG